MFGLVTPFSYPFSQAEYIYGFFLREGSEREPIEIRKQNSHITEAVSKVHSFRFLLFGDNQDFSYSLFSLNQKKRRSK
jgi:hypothetical protein